MAETRIFPRLMHSGHVVQVQSYLWTISATSSTNNAWVDMGLSVNITPKFSDSKIRLEVFGLQLRDGGSFSNFYPSAKFHRNSTPIGGAFPLREYYSTGGGGSDLGWSNGGNLGMIDTPGTTNTITYGCWLGQSGGDTIVHCVVPADTYIYGIPNSENLHGAEIVATEIKA